MPNTEKRKARNKSYYLQHRESILAYQREYRQCNKDKIKAYYDAHRAKILAKAQERYQQKKLEIIRKGRLTDENK